MFILFRPPLRGQTINAFFAPRWRALGELLSCGNMKVTKEMPHQARPLTRIPSVLALSGPRRKLAHKRHSLRQRLGFSASGCAPRHRLRGLALRFNQNLANRYFPLRRRRVPQRKSEVPNCCLSEQREQIYSEGWFSRGTRAFRFSTYIEKRNKSWGVILLVTFLAPKALPTVGQQEKSLATAA